MKISVTRSLTILTLGAGLATATAQNRNLQARLQNAVRIECVFTQMAKGDWTDAGATVALEPADFRATYYDIDVESGTAEAEGRFGASFIIVRYAEGYLHFMHSQYSGPLYVTTILAQESVDGRMKAVHTRHEFTPVSLPGFTSRPEMYIGDCAVE